jgi:hypothetical protein
LFCLLYFLKTNIKFYCIYQYFMSINSFFNTVSVSRYSRRCWINCWYSYNIDKCNKILCLSSRNMIDKTMCEVLWRNISDFYVNLRVEVGKHPQVILAMYFYLDQYFMSINSFFNTVSVSRYSRPITVSRDPD